MDILIIMEAMDYANEEDDGGMLGQVTNISFLKISVIKFRNEQAYASQNALLKLTCKWHNKIKRVKYFNFWICFS